MDELLNEFWSHPIGIVFFFALIVVLICIGVNVIRSLLRIKHATLEEARANVYPPLRASNLLVFLGMQVFWLLFPQMYPTLPLQFWIGGFVIANSFLLFLFGYSWIATYLAKKRIKVLEVSGYPLDK